MNSGQILFDTNVVSYLMKGGRLAEALCAALGKAVASDCLYHRWRIVLRGGEGEVGQAARREKLETTLRNFVVVSYDHEIARCYGRIMTEQRKQRRTIATNDAWIAACAVRHGFPLVTHNTKDFNGISSLEIITEHL